MTAGLEELRRANPRNRHGFDASMEAAEIAVRRRIAAGARLGASGRSPRFGAAAVLASAAAAAIAALTLGSGGAGVERALAAELRRVAAVTAEPAERSGMAEVRITRGGETWAERTVRWHGDDLALGADMLVVGGVMYGVEDGEWVELGPTSSIDTGSGTMPSEYLDAARADVGGATLQRIAAAVSDLTATTLAGGETAYRGSVAAGQIASREGLKDGEALRMLPFGFVAHGAARDPQAKLAVKLTVGADGVLRRVEAAWGSGPGRWTYSVAYRELGDAAAIAAPADARPLRRP